MKFDFNQTMKQAEKDYGLNKGEYFKVQDGDNRIRILSACIPHQSEYKGQPTFKFVAWVVDRRDGVVKPYFMPVTVMNSIGGFQQDVDYAFDEVPMPYDINIKATNAGTKEVVYNVIPSPKPTPVTPEELTELASRLPIEEYVQKLADSKNTQPGSNSASSEASDSEPTVASTPPTQEQVDHYKNLIAMKGYSSEELFDNGIALEDMTSETYLEYIDTLKRLPFKNKADIDPNDIPF